MIRGNVIGPVQTAASRFLSPFWNAPAASPNLYFDTLPTFYHIFWVVPWDVILYDTYRIIEWNQPIVTEADWNNCIAAVPNAGTRGWVAVGGNYAGYTFNAEVSSFPNFIEQYASGTLTYWAIRYRRRSYTSPTLMGPMKTCTHLIA